MPHDDHAPEPAPFRYVPTLTEVVLDSGQAADPASLADARGPAAAAAGVTVEQVLALLGSDLDRRISEAIAQALHEQMLGLNARVRRTVADVVQDAVEVALRRADVGTNPRFRGGED